jgi:hypothetical protein
MFSGSREDAGRAAAAPSCISNPAPTRETVYLWLDSSVRRLAGVSANAGVAARLVRCLWVNDSRCELCGRDKHQLPPGEYSTSEKSVQYASHTLPSACRAMILSPGAL